MELEWIAADPESVNVPYMRRSNVDDYVLRMEQLLALGEGYSEVSLADQAYPVMALSFRNGLGVVHQSPSEDRIYLLFGDGVIGNEEEVEVPGVDGDSRFTGAFVSAVDRA